jgi:hypothetical protein
MYLQIASFFSIYPFVEALILSFINYIVYFGATIIVLFDRRLYIRKSSSATTNALDPC